MKMEAVTKAYADIVSNTCKEASARVMVAERKTRCFEQQLVSLKAESLSMLLRLKEHFNSMIIEAEDRSLKQQMKIEELEAQLDEAEGIIVDLRGELKQVQEQLEITRNNQKKSLNQHILVTAESVQECVSQDYIQNVSDSKSVLVDYEKKIGSLHPTTTSNKSCHTRDNTNLSLKSHLNHSHFPNDDFTSMIMQNGETNHCRNGCTHRIRALEGNLSKVRLPSVPTSQYNDKLPHHISRDKDQAIRYRRRSTRKSSRHSESIASLKRSHKKFGRTKVQSLRGPLKGCSSFVNVQTVETPIELADMDLKKIKISYVSDYADLSCNSENATYAEGEDVLMDSVLVDVPISEGFGSSKICQLANVPISEEFGSSKKCQLPDLPEVEGFGSSHCQLADVPISEEFGSSKNCRLADLPVPEVFGSSHCQLADVPIAEEFGTSKNCRLADLPVLEPFGSSHCQLADVPVSGGFGSNKCQLADVPISEEFGTSKNCRIADLPLPKAFGSSHCQLADVPVSEGIGSNKCQLGTEDRFLKFKFHRKRRKNAWETTDENVVHNNVPLKRKLENPADLDVLENCILKDQTHEDIESMKQVAHQLISLNGAGC